jgi:hypothetical protein
VPLLPYSGYHILLFLGQVPYKTLPAFSNPSTTRDDLTHPVTAAATTQVKLCPYNEDELHIWFRLIEAQFAAAGIRSQKLKYTNTLASLPKQVLRYILDTLDVSNDSDEPFDFWKNTLLRQFGKSKWQYYFELLHLLSVLMGKLINISLQEFPFTQIFFWPCFLSDCRLPCEKR